MAKELKDLTKSDENYSQWYNDLVVKAGLAENSAVRGCMVIDLSSLEFGKLQFCIAQHDAVSICKNVIDTVNKVKHHGLNLILIAVPLFALNLFSNPICSFKSARLLCAVSAVIANASGCARTTRSACVPMEPVEPISAMCLTLRLPSIRRKSPG